MKHKFPIHIAARISENLFDKLDKKCIDTERSESQIIRFALEEYLE